MRAINSVLIITRKGYPDGVFTSFRAITKSGGANYVNDEGEITPYTEQQLKNIASWGGTFNYFGQQCRIISMTLNK